MYIGLFMTLDAIALPLALNLVEDEKGNKGLALHILFFTLIVSTR